MIANRNILITGGSGFIGTTLTSRLIDKNKVTIFDTFDRDLITKSGLTDHPNINCIRGDVRDLAMVENAVAGNDLVIHAAGIAGIQTVGLDPVKTLEVNILGSANVLKAASNLQVERVICFSTSEVYGPNAVGVSEESSSVIGSAGEARWTYAVSKLAEEHLAMAYNRHGRPKLNTVVLRPFNIYGPGQVGEGAIKNFILQALRDEPLVIHGDGSQIRAWCYVDDMVEATIMAASKPESLGQSFNIGNSRSVISVYGLASTIIRVLNSNSKIVHEPHPSVDIQIRIPTTSKASEVLGFTAKVDLEEGLQKTADYFLKNMNV